MICHENKVILIHFEKCGGTSISHFLTNKEWWDVHNEYLKSIRYDDGHEKHLTYDMAKQLYSSYIESFKLVTITRHPYSLFISKFLYNYRSDSSQTCISENDVSNIIGEYKKRWNINSLYEFYYDQTKYDFVIKFENYQQDFKKLCGLLNIDSNKKIREINKQREDVKNQITITDKAKQNIKEYCKEYCLAFGYDIK
jgi:hypothetical protein